MKNKKTTDGGSSDFFREFTLTETDILSLTQSVSDLIIVCLLPAETVVYVNHSSFLGYRCKEIVFSEFLNDILLPADKPLFEDYLLMLKTNQKSETSVRCRNKQGQVEWLFLKGEIIQGTNQTNPLASHVITIKTHHKQVEQLESDRASALEMIARDRPTEKILTDVIAFISNQIEEACPAILIQDEKSLRHVSNSNKLSSQFIQSIDELLKDKIYGPWQTVISGGEILWHANVAETQEWGPFLPLMNQEKVQSTFLMPVQSNEGDLLGVIALYFKDSYPAWERMLKVCEAFAHVIALVINRRQVTDMLFRQANYNLLTQLPNRNMLEGNLNQALMHARRRKQTLALAFMRLENFNSIKETLGYHDIGEGLLKQVTERLMYFVGETNQLAHISDDVFAVILTQLTDRSEAKDLILQMVALLKPPFRVGNNDLYLEVSVGYSVFPMDGDNAPDMIKNVEIALASPSVEEENRIKCFESQMKKTASERLRITNLLHLAVEMKQFILFYQPQVDIINRRVIGFESLIRWKHDEFGFIPPMTFIPLAEDTGLIVKIGSWVLTESCRQLAEWRKEGRPDMHISVNVSPAQFMYGDFVSNLNWALQEYQVPPHLLAIEITEGMLMHNIESVARKLKQIRKMGIEVHVDDFGMGYSSLSYLRKLPVDCLKIDKSFVDAMLEEDEEERVDPMALPSAIVTLGHGLKLSVLAEGVETARQADLLVSLGCDYAQGYLYSKPVPAEQVWSAVDSIYESWQD